MRNYNWWDYNWKGKYSSLVPMLGGLAINKDLFDVCKGGFELKLSLRDHPKLFNEVRKAVVRGYLTSTGGTAVGVLAFLTAQPEAPQMPPMGYLGKRQMGMWVRTDKREEFRVEVTAAGQMIDINLDRAWHVARYWKVDPRVSFMAINSASISGENALPKTKSATRYWGKDGRHLQPVTAKLGPVIERFTQELLPMREEFLAWYDRKPEFRFKYGHNL